MAHGQLKAGHVGRGRGPRHDAHGTHGDTVAQWLSRAKEGHVYEAHRRVARSDLTSVEKRNLSLVKVSNSDF